MLITAVVLFHFASKSMLHQLLIEQQFPYDPQAMNSTFFSNNNDFSIHVYFSTISLAIILLHFSKHFSQPLPLKPVCSFKDLFAVRQHIKASGLCN